jgi:hypothetical protein
MRYHDPEWRPHDEVEAIFASGSEEAICDALAAAALKDDDAEWIESWCVSLAESRSVAIRGLSATCLGHVARRFGEIQPESVTLLRRLSADHEIGGRADDALDDVAMFANQPG